jgi:hypothetical protein
MHQRSSWSYSNAETKLLVEELDIFAKCMSLCGNLINDYPDSLAYELTSRLLNYYGILPHVTALIDDCYRAGIF